MIQRLLFLPIITTSELQAIVRVMELEEALGALVMVWEVSIVDSRLQLQIHQM